MLYSLTLCPELFRFKVFYFKSLEFVRSSVFYLIRLSLKPQTVGDTLSASCSWKCDAFGGIRQCILIWNCLKQLKLVF